MNKNTTQARFAGTSSEKHFESSFSDIIVRKSKLEEDINEHWDYLIKCKDASEIRVDVKSQNKVNPRYPATVRVETVRRWTGAIANKYGGTSEVPENLKKGWVYGEAHLIAYELGTSGTFEFWDRKYLVSILEANPQIRRLDYDEGSQVVYIPRDLLDEKKKIIK